MKQFNVLKKCFIDRLKAITGIIAGVIAICVLLAPIALAVINEKWSYLLLMIPAIPLSAFFSVICDTLCK